MQQYNKKCGGFKTRPFEQILKEVKSHILIHSSENSHLGGIHLEIQVKMLQSV